MPRKRAVPSTKVCFVIMPYSATKDPVVSEDEWTEIFEKTFKPAVESTGYTCVRVAQRPGNFLHEIVKRLDSADLVLADLTASNPNVHYELGIRHARRLGTILVAQELRFIPSDLRMYLTLPYAWKTTKARQGFSRELRRIVEQMHGEPTHSDSPVFDVLGGAPTPSDGPLFKLLPGNSSHIGSQPGDPRKPATFAHVQVFNSGPYAPRVRCGISFFRSDGSPLFADEMAGRWSGAPEPFSLMPMQHGDTVQFLNIPDMSKLPGGDVKDFAQKETDSIAVAVRFEDGSCFGWTQESYFHNAQHPAWQLPLELVRVRTRLIANGLEHVEEFTIDPQAEPPRAFCTRLAATGQTANDLALAKDVETEAPTEPAPLPVGVSEARPTWPTRS